MSIWIKTYVQAPLSDRPTGIPTEWPWLRRDTTPIDPINWIEFANEAAYNAYRATYQAAYDAWLAQWIIDQEQIVEEEVDAVDGAETFVLTPTQIAEKKIVLSLAPTMPNKVRFLPHGGIDQIYQNDFIVVGKEVRWTGLGLDGFLEVGETVSIFYDV